MSLFDKLADWFQLNVSNKWHHYRVIMMVLGILFIPLSSNLTIIILFPIIIGDSIEMYY